MDAHGAIVILAQILLRFCVNFERFYGGSAVTPNIHMHCHLVDCIKDFGPVSSFWLFSFERFNGILGEKPTNNRTIEPQLMKRFVEENFNIQMLFSANTSGAAGKVFHVVVKYYALGFYSLKHLDTQLSDGSPSTSDFVPTSNYSIGIFQEHQLSDLRDLYCVLYPSQLSSVDFVLPCSYRKMDSVTLKGQDIICGQYVNAKPVFLQSEGLPTIFSNPDVRIARIQHFAMHSFHVDSSTFSHIFAIVQWVERHHSQHNYYR